MAYEKIEWKNGADGKTPINAANLNKMDEQIAWLDDTVATLVEKEHEQGEDINLENAMIEGKVQVSTYDVSKMQLNGEKLEISSSNPGSRKTNTVDAGAVNLNLSAGSIQHSVEMRADKIVIDGNTIKYPDKKGTLALLSDVERYHINYFPFDKPSNWDDYNCHIMCSLKGSKGTLGPDNASYTLTMFNGKQSDLDKVVRPEQDPYGQLQLCIEGQVTDITDVCGYYLEADGTLITGDTTNYPLTACRQDADMSRDISWTDVDIYYYNYTTNAVTSIIRKSDAYH